MFFYGGTEIKDTDTDTKPSCTKVKPKRLELSRAIVTITETTKGKTTAARTITRHHARTLISARTRTWFASWRRYTERKEFLIMVCMSLV